MDSLKIGDFVATAYTTKAEFAQVSTPVEKDPSGMKVISLTYLSAVTKRSRKYKIFLPKNTHPNQKLIDRGIFTGECGRNYRRGQERKIPEILLHAEHYPPPHIFESAATVCTKIESFTVKVTGRTWKDT